MATVDTDVPGPDVRDDNIESHSVDEHESIRGSHDLGSPFGVPGPLYRFRDAGNLALSAGIVAGIAMYCWGSLPAWAGFLIGAFSVSVVTALVQAEIDARRSANGIG
jgi:hypothetical protein